MPEYDCMGNVKKSDDETPCFLEGAEIQIDSIYFNELLEQENCEIKSLKKLKNPEKCEITGTLKGRKYTDALRRVVNRSGRKNEDKREEKLPRKFRNGW